MKRWANSQRAVHASVKPLLRISICPCLFDREVYDVFFHRLAHAIFPRL